MTPILEELREKLQELEGGSEKEQEKTKYVHYDYTKAILEELCEQVKESPHANAKKGELAKLMSGTYSIILRYEIPRFLDTKNLKNFALVNKSMFSLLSDRFKVVRMNLEEFVKQPRELYHYRHLHIDARIDSEYINGVESIQGEPSCHCDSDVVMSLPELSVLEVSLDCDTLPKFNEILRSFDIPNISQLIIRCDPPVIHYGIKVCGTERRSIADEMIPLDMIFKLMHHAIHLDIPRFLLVLHGELIEKYVDYPYQKWRMVSLGVHYPSMFLDSMHSPKTRKFFDCVSGIKIMRPSNAHMTSFISDISCSHIEDGYSTSTNELDLTDCDAITPLMFGKLFTNRRDPLFKNLHTLKMKADYTFAGIEMPSLCNNGIKNMEINVGRYLNTFVDHHGCYRTAESLTLAIMRRLSGTVLNKIVLRCPIGEDNANGRTLALDRNIKIKTRTLVIFGANIIDFSGLRGMIYLERLVLCSDNRLYLMEGLVESAPHEKLKVVDIVVEKKDLDMLNNEKSKVLDKSDRSIITKPEALVSVMNHDELEEKGIVFIPSFLLAFGNLQNWSKKHNVKVRIHTKDQLHEFDYKDSTKF